MNQPLKIVKIGDAAGVILPAELLARLGVAAGDDLYLSANDGGYHLSRDGGDLSARKRALAEDIMQQDREILRVLAQ